MTNNPFTKTTFESIWLEHFKNASEPIEFKAIQPVKFYKSKILPLYINVGKNITNGIFYQIDDQQNDYRGKVFLVYDVPEYFNILSDLNKRLKVKKARQYKGFLSNLEGFNSFTEYFNHTFKSKSKNRYRKNLKRLETCFNIKYKTFYGAIEEDEYRLVFESLKQILERRFSSLNLDNDILLTWNYYYELAYEMILRKEAVLLVVYDGAQPIAISLGFVSDKVLFFAITSFDIDYYKFHLGHIIIIKLLEWCFEHEYKILDYSKGEYNYKERWANHEYNFETHILYDSKSFTSVFIANTVALFFRFKQYLRDKNVNYLYSRIKFLLRGKPKPQDVNFEMDVLQNDGYVEDLGDAVSINSKELNFLKAPLFNQLYANPEKVDKIKVYKSISRNRTYYAIGEINKLKISISE